VVERPARGGGHLDQPFPPPGPPVGHGAVVAVRVVAGPAEEGVRRPGAAAPADVGELAGPAVSPQRLAAAVGRGGGQVDGEFGRVGEQVGQAPLAQVAGGVGGGRQRWAPDRVAGGRRSGGNGGAP
jgi:hypothetical protein